MDPYDWFGQGQPESPFAAEELPQPNLLGGPQPPANPWQARVDVPPDGRTAAVRYNNPGAQYPSQAAARFGMEGYGIIGGGHKIAKFPSEEHGAAANMDNFARSYKGMTLADAVRKWRGGNGSVNVPAGFDPSARVDDTFLGDRDRMSTFFDRMSQHEGRGNAGPIAPATWQRAFDLYRGSAQPQITSQVGSPTASAQPAPSAASRGQPGMLDKLLSAIGITPAVAAEAQPPANSEAMIASLGRMGITPDSPEFGAFSELAKALSAGKKPPEERSGMGKAFDVFSDTLGTGLLQRGGLKVPLLADQRHAASSKERQALEERAYQAQLSLLGTALPHRLTQIKEQRDLAETDRIMGNQPLAPGGAGGVQLPPRAGGVAPAPSAGPGAPPVGPQMPAGPTAAPMPVDRMALPEPGAAGLAPESEAATTPAMPPQATPSGLPPSIAPQAAATPSLAPPAGPSQVNPNPQSTTPMPSGPAGPASKYKITEEQLEPPRWTSEQIVAMQRRNPKMAEGMEATNKAIHDRNQLKVKLYEVGRSGDDPESAKQKKVATLDAEREGALTTSRVDATRAMSGIINSIKSLDDLATSPKFTELAIGSIDSNKEGILPWGFGPSGQTIARGMGMFHDTGPDEVRSAIEQRARGIAATMKPFVRKPGEGAWSDKDQEALENMVGDLTKARDATDLRRRIRNIHSLIGDTFAKPLGVEIKDHGLPDVGGTASVLAGKDGQQSAGSPQAGLTPDKATEIQRRYQSADPAMKAAIEKSLVDKGIDPKTVLGGAPAAMPSGAPDTPEASYKMLTDRLRAGGGSGQPTPPRPRSFPGHLIDGEAF